MAGGELERGVAEVDARSYVADPRYLRLVYG